MKLTHRQRDFLEKFRELYRKVGAPLHYTEVAQHLGVGKITAYEMLRTLERKGVVSSRYRKQVSGEPGRSQVVFCPKESSESTSGVLEAEKKRVLALLRETDEKTRSQALDAYLARLQTLNDPVSFLASAIGALLINLPSLESEARDRIEEVIKASLQKDSWVHVVAGIAVVLLGAQAIEHGTAVQLVNILGKYYEHFAALPSDKKAELAEFVKEVIKAI